MSDWKTGTSRLSKPSTASGKLFTSCRPAALPVVPAPFRGPEHCHKPASQSQSCPACKGQDAARGYSLIWQQSWLCLFSQQGEPYVQAGMRADERAGCPSPLNHSLLKNSENSDKGRDLRSILGTMSFCVGPVPFRCRFLLFPVDGSVGEACCPCRRQNRVKVSHVGKSQ